MDSKNENRETQDHGDIENWEAAKAATAAFVQERDWEQFHALKELIIGLNVEAGELLEHTLWAERGAFEDEAIHEGEKRKAILDECADILFFLIRILDRMDADPWNILEQKMKQNARKYPVERARGRSDKYTAYQD